MADNETNIGNPSVDVDIIPKFVAVEQSMAQLVRSCAELKPVIYARVAIDRAVTGGVGEQVQRAVDEATGKFRFAMKTMGNAEELQTGLRACQADLEMMVGQAKELKINLGGQAVSLTGKQQVAPFIANIPNLVGAAVPAGTAAKLSIVGKEQVEMTAATTAASAKLNTFGHTLEQATRATIAKTRAEETAANQLNLAQRVGAGQPLRRAIAPAITSALGGSDAAALTGGIMAMVMQSMMFRVGWMAMAAIEHSPAMVDKAVQEWRFAGGIKYRATTPEGAAAWQQATGLGRSFFSGYALQEEHSNTPADEAYLKYMEEVQQYGPAAKNAKEEAENAKQAQHIVTRTLVAAIAMPAVLKNPDALIKTWVEAKADRDERSRVAFGTNEFAKEALIEKYAASPQFVKYGPNAKSYASGFIDQAIQRMPGTVGAIPLSEIENAVEWKLSNDPRIEGVMKGQTDEWRWRRIQGPQGHELWRDQAELPAEQKHYVEAVEFMKNNPESSAMWGGWSPIRLTKWLATPGGTLSKGPGHVIQEFEKAHPDQVEPLRRLAAAEAGDWRKMPGLEDKTALDPAHGLVGAHAYQFSSITGLAEQMQMMASGGGIPEQQLSESQKQTALQQEIRDRLPQSGVQHAPLGRMLSIEGPKG